MATEIEYYIIKGYNEKGEEHGSQFAHQLKEAYKTCQQDDGGYEIGQHYSLHTFGFANLHLNGVTNLEFGPERGFYFEFLLLAFCKAATGMSLTGGTSADANDLNTDSSLLDSNDCTLM